MVNKRTGFGFVATLVFFSHFVVAAVYSQNSEPPGDVREYRKLRQSIIQDIIDDLQDDDTLDGNWPNKHTRKVMASLGKLESKYRSADKSNLGADKPQNWSDYVSRETLIWEGIQKKMESFGSVHNKIIESLTDVDRELNSDKSLMKAFDSIVEETDLLLLAIDDFKEPFADVFPNGQVMKLTGMAISSLTEFDAIGSALKQTGDFLKYIKLNWAGLNRQYGLNKSFRQNIFQRDIPAKYIDMKMQAQELQKQISDIKRSGERLINPKLMTYSSFKELAEAKAYRELESGVDSALGDQIDDYQIVSEKWDSLMESWNDAMYEEHKGISAYFQPGFTNSSEVFKLLQQWHKEKQEAIEDVEEIDQLLRDRAKDLSK
jgi:hypothetical protein